MRNCFFESFISKKLFIHKMGFCLTLGLVLGAAGFSSTGMAQQAHKEKQSQHHKRVRHHTKASSSNTTTVNSQVVNTAQHPINSPSNAVTSGAVATVGGAAAVGATGTTVSNSNQIPSATGNGGTTGQISSNGQPIPRFASLRADEVNMRAGPGTRYPIIWVYHRRSMPVKILRDFDVWRLVEDVDGQKGWIQQAILSGSRSLIVTGAPLSEAMQNLQSQNNKKDDKTKPEHTDSIIVGYLSTPQSIEQDKNNVVMRENPEITATPVAVLKSGVVGHIKECPTASEWCKVSVKGYTGWLSRNSFWGLLPQEIIQKS